MVKLPPESFKDWRSDVSNIGARTKARIMGGAS